MDDRSPLEGPPPDSDLRRTLRIVVALNLAMAAVEIVAALASGSVSLFADSVDFLEDASISLLVLASLRWSAAARGRVGAGLVFILLAPSLATLAMAWQRFRTGTAPEPLAIGVVGLIALAANTGCALLLARHRTTSGSLTRAAFLSARNDTLANLAIVAAGAAMLRWPSPWPDLIVGLAIGLLNAGAAWEVWEAARDERRAASADPHADP